MATILYGLVIDMDEGNSEDFNFNYLESDHFELYVTEEERDERIKVLDNIFNQVEVFDQDKELPEVVYIKFEAQMGRGELIPKVLNEAMKDYTEEGVLSVEVLNEQTGDLKLEWLNDEG